MNRVNKDLIPFGEYLPDLPDFNNPGSPSINNCLPHAVSYLPLKQLSAASDALTDYCRGAASVRSSGAVAYTYAGDETNLYEITGSDATVTDISGSTYTTGADENWEFAKFGEKVIATNFSDAPQIETIAASSFGALGGSPPKARHIMVVKDFVVLGNLNESGTLTPNKVRWSGINNEASWAQSATTLADSQTLHSEAKYGGGWIMAMRGGEYGLIWQENSIWRMTFIGSPFVFQFDEILPGHGTPARNSVVQYGKLCFYLGQQGFEMLVNGVEVVPIGANKVDKTFLNDLDTTAIHRMVGAVDPVNRIVCWIYPGSGNTSGTPNKMICYDWINKKWSPADIDSQWIYGGVGQSYTLEQLDNVNSSLDALPASLDSRVWSEGALQLAGFNTDNKMSFFTGDTLAAVLETPERQLFPGSRGFVHGARAMVDGSATVKVGSRDRQQDSVVYTDASTPHSETDIAHFRNNARYQRIQVTTSGNFNHAQGVDVFGKAAGAR